MKKRTRRIFLVLAILVFGAASYVAVLYAQGYKYSFTDNAFIRTGALALKTDRAATVLVNGKVKGSTAFLSNGFGVNRLLPGRYDIRVEADGYMQWRKSATVQEGFVTDFPRIVLVPLAGTERQQFIANASASFSQVRTLADATPFPSPAPKNPRVSPTPKTTPSVTVNSVVLAGQTLSLLVDDVPQKIATNVRGFAVSPDGSRVLWWNQNELWVLWLSDTNYQPLKEAGDKELVTRFGASITRAAWYPDNDHIMAAVASQWRFTEIDTRGGLNIVSL